MADAVAHLANLKEDPRFKSFHLKPFNDEMSVKIKTNQQQAITQVIPWSLAADENGWDMAFKTSVWAWNQHVLNIFFCFHSVMRWQENKRQERKLHSLEFLVEEQIIPITPNRGKCRASTRCEGKTKSTISLRARGLWGTWLVRWLSSSVFSSPASLSDLEASGCLLRTIGSSKFLLNEDGDPRLPGLTRLTMA